MALHIITMRTPLATYVRRVTDEELREEDGELPAETIEDTVEMYRSMMEEASDNNVAFFEFKYDTMGGRTARLIISGQQLLESDVSIETIEE